MQDLAFAKRDLSKFCTHTQLNCFFVDKKMIYRFSIKYGLALGLVTALATQVLTWAGLGLTQWFIVATFVLVAIFSVLSSKQLKIRLGGRLTFRQALAHIIVLILVGRLVFQAYMFLYTRYIDPSWIDEVSRTWSETMEASGMARERAEMVIERFEQSYKAVNMFTTTLIQYAVPQVILGLLLSLYFVFRK